VRVLPCVALAWSTLPGCVQTGLNPVESPAAWDCPDETEEATVSPEPTCASPVVPAPVTAPWNVRLLWSYGVADEESADVTPVVGYLADDDGSGSLRPGDRPVVVVAVMPAGESNGWVAALDGATGQERWRWAPVNAQSSALTLADLDSDGVPEVLAVDADRFVVALSGNGELVWRAATPLRWQPSTLLVGRAVGGETVVVAGDSIFDGADGALRAVLGVETSSPFLTTVLADLDLDGDPEILTGASAYSLAGELLWSDHRFSMLSPVAPIVTQLDSDPEGEVLLAERTVYADEHDGTPIEWPAPIYEGFSWGIPCLGDLDGDGASDLAWPVAGWLVALTPDGTVRWQIPTSDVSGLAGCTLADLDADGRMEVLYGDEEAFLIVDGSTGAVLFRDDARASGTSVEVPVPADVDGDGHLDIVVVSESDAAPVQVYTHDGGGWAPGGVGWGVYDYAVTNSSADGTLPRQLAPWWQSYDMLRARPAADPIFLADLVLSAVEP
jgi:outer membrane protein assembly factor BamB